MQKEYYLNSLPFLNVNFECSLTKNSSTKLEVALEYKYSKVLIKPDALYMNLTVIAESTKEIYNEIAKVTNDILKLNENITDVCITLNETSIHITKEKLMLITPEYIEGGFNIEDLDE